MFDKTVMRPGCILIQAAAGMLIGPWDLNLISHGEGWLVSHTVDMKPYTIHTKEEFDQVRMLVMGFHMVKENERVERSEERAGLDAPRLRGRAREDAETG
jgi:hypothetical protein